jgi:hypothetical protein
MPTGSPVAEEMPPLPGFTADQPHVESYPIRDHDPSDYVESFPIGEETGPLVLDSVDTPAARFSGKLLPQEETRSLKINIAAEGQA